MITLEVLSSLENEILDIVFSTTDDEARITHLHTRNRLCSIALRRHSGHGATALLVVFSVVVFFKERYMRAQKSELN